MVAIAPGLRFELPDELLAREPPEKRGLSRDGVRLLAADRGTGTVVHSRFDRIGDFLRPGDCLVFNASRTLPATLRATQVGGAELLIRLARRNEDDTWSVLPLSLEEEPWLADLRGARLKFGTGAAESLVAEVLDRDPLVDRLWRVRFSRGGSDLMGCLSRLGQPVRYWYSAAPWDLDYYQTVYASEPGSMEMPSAGRAFSWQVLLGLRRRGITTAFLILHAGLSSYLDEAFDAGHPASVEPFRLEAEAAAAINAAKARGGRIIAVGTTVVRTLETIAAGDGRVRAQTGRTCLRITPGHSLRAVDGLLTGFHEPHASHLDLLSAFMPPDRLGKVYAEALDGKYLWHEFGDANLIL